MTDDDPIDFDAVVDAMATLIGLPMTDEFRPGVVTNLKVTAALAGLVLDFPLDDHAEPAAVFRA